VERDVLRRAALALGAAAAAALALGAAAALAVACTTVVGFPDLPVPVDAGADTGPQVAYLFGGLASQNKLPVSAGDTWSFRMSGWTALSPSVAPSARSGAGLATFGDKLVLFGGSDDFADDFDDTWTFDGERWVEADNGKTGAPPARSLPAMAALPGEVVMFGGYLDSTAATLGDTWTWDGHGWTRQHPAVAPSARCGAATGPLGGKLVLFGGEVKESGAFVANDETWTYDGTAWTELHPSIQPAGRGFAAMVAQGDVLVLFGGSADSGAVAFNDTWTWDGSDWTKQRPTAAPSPRASPGVATVDGKVILFSGYDSVNNVLLNDLWSWDGQQWSPLRVPAGGPSARNQAVMGTL
jgi:hypothetical protein